MKKRNDFYNSLFVIGARPTIMWIVAIALFLLFPVQIVLVYLEPFYNFNTLLDYSRLNELQAPIITLTVAIVSIRTVEKLRHNKEKPESFRLDNRKYRKEI